MLRRQPSRDTEHRYPWLRHGERLEQAFVALMQSHASQYGVGINPDKAATPTAPDLVDRDGRLADLKAQFTPFFSAGRYGLSPRYTFSFNAKDMERYERLYPGLTLFVWVNWTQTSLKVGGHVRQVDPYHAIYRVRFSEITRAKQEGRLALHHYKNRQATRHGFRAGLVDAQDNAAASWLIDLRAWRPILCMSDVTAGSG